MAPRIIIVTVPTIVSRLNNAYTIQQNTALKNTDSRRYRRKPQEMLQLFLAKRIPTKKLIFHHLLITFPVSYLFQLVLLVLPPSIMIRTSSWMISIPLLNSAKRTQNNVTYFLIIYFMAQSLQLFSFPCMSIFTSSSLSSNLRSFNTNNKIKKETHMLSISTIISQVC